MIFFLIIYLQQSEKPHSVIGKINSPTLDKTEDPWQTFLDPALCF